MNKRILWMVVMVVSVASNAASKAPMSRSEMLAHQQSLLGNKAYLTSNGNKVTVMIPISQLYDGKTTYLIEDASSVTEVLSALISRSNGRISLQGLLNADTKDMNFNKSAVYAQVSHLSQHLLGRTTDVSYAPVTVTAYEKNNNYGIWSVFPKDEIFLNLNLIIDL